MALVNRRVHEVERNHFTCPFFLIGRHCSTTLLSLFLLSVPSSHISFHCTVLSPAPVQQSLKDLFPARKHEDFMHFSWNRDFKNLMFYHVFHLFWSLQFIIYFTFMVYAGAVAEWYFTPYQSGSKPRGNGELVGDC